MAIASFEPYEVLSKIRCGRWGERGRWWLCGAITAALFLQRFVGKKPWAHFDVYGWNPEAKPGRPGAGGPGPAFPHLFFRKLGE